MRRWFVALADNRAVCSSYHVETHAISERRQHLQQRREDLHAAMYFHEDEIVELNARDQQIDEERYDDTCSFLCNAVHLVLMSTQRPRRTVKIVAGTPAGTSRSHHRTHLSDRAIITSRPTIHYSLRPSPDTR